METMKRIQQIHLPHDAEANIQVHWNFLIQMLH